MSRALAILGALVVVTAAAWAGYVAGYRDCGANLRGRS